MLPGFLRKIQLPNGIMPLFTQKAGNSPKIKSAFYTKFTVCGMVFREFNEKLQIFTFLD
jgi:hypothetical protein